MSFPSATRTLSAVLLAGGTLAACSEFYFERRETISLATGDAMASNRVTQAIDPWPPVSANRNITYSGEKMQVAAERYRTGKVIPPASAMTSSTNYSQPVISVSSGSSPSPAGGAKP